ncbi:MAG: hypothetical protein ACI4IS_00550 [Acutalibacteraceae bacterium]
MQVKKKKKLIFANVFLLLVMAAGATYAWFALNTLANVTVNEVQIAGHGDLEMTTAEAPGDTDWKAYLTLTESNYPNLSMIDVSGAGDGVFYRPKTVDNNGNPGESATWLNVSDNPDLGDTLTENHNGANKDYMKIDLKLRAKSKDPVTVALKPGSELQTVAPPDKLTGADIVNKSAYGEFSKDCVVGGMRVSAATKNGETVDRKFTWIPRPEIKLTVQGETLETRTYTVDTKVIGDADTTTHKYVTAEGNTPTEHNLMENLITGPITPETDTETTQFITLSDGSKYEGYQYGEVTFYVWLEGCDTEARRALVGGKFRLRLLLDTKDDIIVNG